jgi:DNA-binding GntR family transcriptional regulator
MTLQDGAHPTAGDAPGSPIGPPFDVSAPAAMPASSATAAATAPAGDDAIYERILSAVLDRHLPPGTLLVEEQLAGAFGVSRTRIRPVLARLAGEHLVTLTPHRRATITRPTAQEAREVFEARRLIEPTLVAFFVERATADDVEELRRCVEAEEQARRAGDLRRAIRLAGDFHLRLSQGAGHLTLGRILRELVSRTTLVLMTYGPADAAGGGAGTACGCQDHRALIDALRLRDAAEAARRMVEHLARLEAQLCFTPAVAAAPDLARLFGANP